MPSIVFAGTEVEMPDVEDVERLVHVLCSLTSFFVVWRLCILLVATDLPVVVVMSESMEPTFQRGDILLVHNWSWPPIVPGDIVVYCMRMCSRSPLLLPTPSHSLTQDEAARRTLCTASSAQATPWTAQVPSGSPRETTTTTTIVSSTGGVHVSIGSTLWAACTRVWRI